MFDLFVPPFSSGPSASVPCELRTRFDSLREWKQNPIDKLTRRLVPALSLLQRRFRRSRRSGHRCYPFRDRHWTRYRSFRHLRYHPRFRDWVSRFPLVFVLGARCEPLPSFSTSRFIKACIAPLIADQSPIKRQEVQTLPSGEKVIVDPGITIQSMLLVYYWSVNVSVETNETATLRVLRAPDPRRLSLRFPPRFRLELLPK